MGSLVTEIMFHKQNILLSVRVASIVLGDDLAGLNRTFSILSMWSFTIKEIKEHLKASVLSLCVFFAAKMMPVVSPKLQIH